MKPWRERFPKLNQLMQYLESTYEGTDATSIQLAYGAIAELDAEDRKAMDVGETKDVSKH